jgi:hypothetical protein
MRYATHWKVHSEDFPRKKDATAPTMQICSLTASAPLNQCRSHWFFSPSGRQRLHALTAKFRRIAAISPERKTFSRTGSAIPATLCVLDLDECLFQNACVAQA